MPMSRRNLSLLAVLTTVLITATLAWADVVKLAPNHPDRYVVVKGDTLWGIATRFLQDPWRWASVWKINQQIKNPHLIYPGDVIVLTYVDGQPVLSVLPRQQVPAGGGETTPAAGPATEPLKEPPPELGSNVVKLRPQVRAEELKEAIPTISPDAILPFLTQPLVVGSRELEQAGYVTVGLDDRVALGDGSQFYARGLKDRSAEYYQIFRQGAPLKNPETNELLGYEAMYLGDAQVLREGDPAKLVVTRVKQEIVPTDRLLAEPKRASLPYYYPHAPETQVRGRILTGINGLREFGSGSIVCISLGEREGMQEGHVLRIMRFVGKLKDPVTRGFYDVPDEESGLLMVFRVYEKVSYALIMNAAQPIHLNDSVRTP
jgi:hypothetical protein